MAIYKGDKEIVGLYKGPTEIIKRYKGSNLIYNAFKWLPYSYEHIYNSLVPQYMNKSKIPEEYQEVEYIEGDGGQYMSVINNLDGKSIDGNLTVGYKFQATVHDRGMYFSTIEASTSAGQTYSLGYTDAAGPLYIRWNQIADSTTEVTGYQVGDILEITRTNNVQTTLKMYSLFTHRASSSLTWKGRIYKYWLKLNGEYLFNWIPCYRKSDNVIGLYDLISGTFATNIGTGTFLKGADVKRAVKDKAQVCTIYGDSVVENQLCFNGDFGSGATGWAGNSGAADFSVVSVSNNVLTQTYASTPDAAYKSGIIQNGGGFYKQTYANHYYLAHCKFKSSIACSVRMYMEGTGYFVSLSVPANQWVSYSFIKQATQDKAKDYVFVNITDATALKAGDVLEFAEVEVIDLSQWFPFNTPTTLTDTRVQEIINRGHISYNAGTLKSVDIGEITSEPYNLFDGALEIGSIRQDNGQNNDNITGASRSKNYIKVVPGYSYTLEYPTTANLIIYEYDENNGYIESYSTSSTTSVSITLTNITRYVRFAIGNNDLTAKVCFHKTGARTGYEPIKTFNLWDEETILALLQYDKNASDFGQQISGSNVTSKNYISVLPNKEYSVSGASPQANMVLFCYDENKNAITVGNSGYIAIKSNGQTFTTPSGCRYVRFYMSNPYGTAYNHDICINVSGNKNGTYLPYGVADRLSLPYQGSGVGTAHDTLEITDTEYVFTKNITEDNLSNYAFYYADSTKFLYTTRELNGCRTDSIWSPNAMTNISGYKLVDSNKLSDNDVAYTIYTGKFYIRNDALTEQQLKDVIANKTIKYQLAKPQVIRIPRKHLAVVDLGSLSGYISNDKYFISSEYLGINNTSSNDNGYACYCKDYLIDSGYNVYNKTKDKTMCLTSPFIGGNLVIYNSSFIGKTAEEIKALLSGVYFFYETEDEVVDIISDINVEAGGSVTTNWFSWVENQLAVLTRESSTLRGITLTKNGDNDLSVSGTSQKDENFVIGTFNNISGHKYLARTIFLSGKPTELSGYWIKWKTVNYGQDIGDGIIFTGTATENSYIIFTIDNANITVDCRFRLQLIDLTLGFGEGKEPTSIDDPRIQYIIKQGYIPTNTTGTNKSISSEVLPNIDFKIKCK